MTIPHGRWEFYFATFPNGGHGSIFVDLDHRDAAPDPSRPHLLWFSLQMKAPRPDGFNSPEEFEDLKAVEDAVIPAVSAAHNAIYVGRITCDGFRDFYVYGATRTGFEETVRAVMTGFPTYAYLAEVHDDPDWNQYIEVLYPTDDQMRTILNLPVVERLAQHGDDGKRPRPIDHWQYFPDASSRSACRDEAVAAGFVVTEEWDLDASDDAERPHGLRLQRTDPADWHAINAVTIDLARTVRRHGGAYDGWETPILGAPTDSDSSPGE